MVAGPPQSALLSSGASEKCNEELHHSSQLVSPVREIPMVAAGDEEHAPEVEGETENEVTPGRGKPEHAEGQKVQKKERDFEGIEPFGWVSLDQRGRDRDIFVHGIF